MVSFSKLPSIGTLTQIDIPKALNTIGTFSWTYRRWLAGGVAIFVVASLAIHYFKNRLQYPIVRLKSSLNCAKITVEVPKKNC